MLSDSSILITGGTGSLGKALTAYLLKKHKERKFPCKVVKKIKPTKSPVHKNFLVLIFICVYSFAPKCWAIIGAIANMAPAVRKYIGLYIAAANPTPARSSEL